MLKFSQLLSTQLKSLKMSQISAICTIAKYEDTPIKMFQTLLSKVGSKFITMNIATVDSEFGVLNRTVVYRGQLKDDNESIVFVTERNSRKYKNLKENPRIATTFLFPEVIGAEGQKEIWQVRLFDAEATELSESQISSYWAEEGLHARIRSHICECGKPINHDELVKKHDELLKEYVNKADKLEKTDTYTAFKISAKRWDFYKSMENAIATRVQYRKEQRNGHEMWCDMNVAP